MKESETALAAVLTPEELLDYNLRFSMTANMMRMQLAGFEPTEQEFLELFKKRKAYDDEFGMPGMTALGKSEKEKADAAKKELDAQDKASLGDTRYADYERSQDYSFQSIYRVADKNGLTKDDAVKVYDMKNSPRQAKKVRVDQSRSPRHAPPLCRASAPKPKCIALYWSKAYDAYVNQRQRRRLLAQKHQPRSAPPP
jgi:hypothetical protein